MPRKHVPEPAAWPTVGPAGPSRGAGAWRQGQDTHARPIGGRRGACGAWPRCRRAAAGPGQASSRRARSHPSDQAPPVWRAPEGPEGTGGLRGAAPNEVKTPSLAGGRGLRRPEHQRGHKQQKQEGRRGACGAWPRCRRAAAGPGRASRSTAPSEARVWRSRGRAAAHRHTQRPGPFRQATRRPEIWRDHSHNRQRPGRLLHNSPHGSSPRRPRRISYDVRPVAPHARSYRLG